MLTALSILSATAAPNIQEYVDTARLTKARGDVQVLVVSMVRLMVDVGGLAGRPGGAGARAPEVLVGPGDVPDATTPETARWSDPLDQARVGEMTGHLVENTVGYPVGGGAARRWRGPYVMGLSADPWGLRYGMNIGFLNNREGYVTLVLSAGPNGLVETPFQMTGGRPYGDDIVGLVRSGH